ncbi:MAG: hydantoinase B/oxoprolinase family protein [Pseudomonadota bacterium]
MSTDSCDFKIDPITYEVVKHSIWQTLWEGRSTMEKVSGSVVVTEAKEVLFSLHQPNGETIVSSAGLLLHISGVEKQIGKVIEWYTENPGINDGDVFMFNDPYIGGIHAPDQTCFCPVYYQGEMIGWLSALFHTGEVGAIEPGGMCPSATEIFHEGIRIPGLKLMDKGVERKDTYMLLQRAVRDPGGITLDCRARVAGLNVGKDRIIKLFNKYGKEDMQSIFVQMINDTRAYAKAKLKELPDGVWRDVTYIDHDGKNYNLAKIVTTLTKKGDRLTVDFTGSDPQRPGPTNMVYESVVGVVYTILCTRLFYVEQWNRGVLDVVDIIAPEGCIENANWPAPVSMSAFHVLQLCAILNTLVSRMMVGVPEYYGDQNACSPPNSAVIAWGGPNQYGLVMGTVFFDILSGGQGAGSGFDGVDSGCFPVTPEVIAGDVEMYESIMPFIYLVKRQAINSAGAGKYRGGTGMEVIYKVHNTPGVQVLILGWNKETTGGPGLWGGHQPAPYKNYVANNTTSDAYLASGKAITCLEDIKATGGDQKEWPTMVSATPAFQGDIYYLYGVGAGGYGDPLDREPERVLADIINLIITPEYAIDIYGVVIEGKNEGINIEATEKQRELLKAKRRERAASTCKAPALNCAPIEEGIIRIHENLQITKDKKIQCLKCGHVFCGNDQNYKDHALKAEIKGCDIGANYLQTDRFLVYHEFYCPSCTTLLCQDALPPGTAPVWDVQVGA